MDNKGNWSAGSSGSSADLLRQYQWLIVAAIIGVAILGAAWMMSHKSTPAAPAVQYDPARTACIGAGGYWNGFVCTGAQLQTTDQASFVLHHDEIAGLVVAAVGEAGPTNSSTSSSLRGRPCRPDVTASTPEAGHSPELAEMLIDLQAGDVARG